jgi:phage gpG-like protein
MTIDISFRFPEWSAKLRAHEAELNLFQAAVIQTNRGLLFDQEGSRNGHAKWAPLSLRNGQILSKRGSLRKSIAPYNANGQPGPDGIVKFAGDVISVGTSLLYARMMNDGTAKMPGGVLRPTKAKALRIPIPEGKNAGPGAKDIQAKALAPRIAAAHQRAMLARNPETQAKAVATWERLMKRAKDGAGPVKFIFVKSVKIPPRNFTDWNEADQAELDGSLVSKVAEILNG